MLVRIAQANMQGRLANNPYPGRGIVAGKNTDGLWIQVYWIMGRSANSRNRIFVVRDGLLRTEAADPSKVEDPSLIIYNAMCQVDKRFIATNGDQTDTIVEGLGKGLSFEQALACRCHEPDDPNFTPRISNCIDLSDPAGSAVWMSVIKRSPFDSDHSIHLTTRCPMMAQGFGYCVTTYMGNGNPLPSFEGEPYLVTLEGDPKGIAQQYWTLLNGDNRISLAVRSICPKTLNADICVINQYGN